MSDGLSESAVEGRPSPGGALALEMQSAAERRGSTRKLTALSTLWPILKAHGFETFIACLLMVATSSATLGMSGAVRLLVEHLTSNQSGESVDRWFWLLGAVAVALGLFTALRYYWVTRLGERIVADLRKSVYGHILTLDPAFFIATRTGEVLSRLTTDIQIIENLLATTASVFLRNTLIMIGWGIFAWASVAIGFKASNLTNRGIVQAGPYRFCRHPAYTVKLFIWVIEAVFRGSWTIGMLTGLAIV
jgi:ATP-binding cassette subfamily B protein